MADDTIGRADYELRARVDQLKQDLAAAEGEIAKSGTRAESDFTKRSAKWGPAIAVGVKTGLKVVGASAASMFAIASKGALELTQITNDYQSQTGATAEEAKRAGQVINKVAGENQQSLEAVSAAAIAVHNDLGLVGAQADDVLARMVQFARVTKQEPVAAVKAFDDILDAWNLTAADSQKIMDTLVLSHQKYGGSVSDDQTALAQLAPTLRAMNGTWQDAVGLLDLAKASGLNTADAIAGLNKALGKVKSPEELQRLIADISSTEDPFLRAQKAADLFGQKAGPKLANALAGKTLDDFKINMDEAAGATDRAAEALDQGFGPQIQKKLSEFGASLRGLGADWGPLLTGAAGFGSLLGALGIDTLAAKLGPKFVAGMKAVGKEGGDALVDAAGTATGALGTIIGNNISNRLEAIFAPGETVLGKVWRRLAASRVVLAASTAAGVASGAAYSAAVTGGQVLEQAMAATWGRLIATPAVAGAIEASGITAAGVFSAAATGAFLAAPIVVAWAFSTIPHDNRTTPGANTLDPGAMLFAPPKIDEDALKKSFASIDWESIVATTGGAAERSWERLGHQLLGATGDGAAAEAPRTAASIGNTLAKEMASHGAPWIKSAHDAGERAMEGIAQGIFDARQKPLDAFNTLKDLLKHPMGTLKEQARLAGELTSKALAQGLNSNDEGIRDFARSTKQYQLDQLTSLAAKSGHISAKASAAIEAGLKSRNATVRKNSADAKLAYLDGLQQYVERAGKLSKDAAAAVERGIKSKNTQIHNAALHIKELATTPLVTAKDGAYTDGANVSKTFASGLIDPAAMARIRDNAAKAAGAAADFLHGKSPPPKGPLHTIDEGGANVTKAWAKGLGSAVDQAARHAGLVADAARHALIGSPYSVSAMVPRGMALAAAGGSTAATNHYGGNVSIGAIHLHGVGSDVSPAAALRFGEQIRRTVASNFQQGSARRGLSVAVRP